MKAGGKPQEPLKAHPAFETNFGAADMFNSLEYTKIESKERQAALKIAIAATMIENLKMGMKK
jgi:glutamate mutase epsilon subunit